MAISSCQRETRHQPKRKMINLCPSTKAAISLGIRSQSVADISTAYSLVIKFLGFDGLDTSAYSASTPLEMKFAMVSIARNFSTVAR